MAWTKTLKTLRPLTAGGGFLHSLHASSNTEMLEKAKIIIHVGEIHARMIRSSEIEDVLIVSRLIFQCAISNYSNMKYARSVFERIKHPNIFIWNTMIRGYARSHCPREGLLMYEDLLRRGYVPNNYTFPFVLKAASVLMDLRFGSKIHGVVLKLGFHGCDTFIETSLVSFYVACGYLDAACQVFDECALRDVTCWNSMINGYVKECRYRDAIQVFWWMHHEGIVRPDDITMLTVLGACGHLGALNIGRWLHEYIEENNIRCNVNLWTALVDMYAKCGKIDIALKLFNDMPVRDAYTWSVIIGGLAMHGLAKEALAMFSDMQVNGVGPDSITFTAVLCACSHGGLVEEGLMHLKSMNSTYGIIPAIEHYGCIVDLFSRAGHVEEAFRFIETIPLKPDAVLWGSLFVACKTRGNAEIGELVARKILDLDPSHGGAYVYLSNFCATSRKWEGVQQTRNLMKDQHIVKPPGYSSIELNGMIHEFVSGDRSHPQIEKIQMLLDAINDHLN